MINLIVNFLDKYLIFIAATFFIAGVFNIGGHYGWSITAFTITNILFVIEKRRSIKKFFFTKGNLLYKYVMGITSILVFFLYFIEDADEDFYLFIVSILVMLLVILLVYEKTKERKNKGAILKTNGPIWQAVIPGGIIVLYFLVFFGLKNFDYVFKTVVAIIFVFFAIYIYRKKSIRQE